MDRQLSTKKLRKNKPSRREYRSLQKHPVVVALDGVSNGYNIGSILRTSEALMIEKVIANKREKPVNISSKKIKKAAKGAEKWVDFEVISSLESRLDDYKNNGYQIVAVELCEQSEDYRKIRYQSPLVSVFGSEDGGVSEAILEKADRTVHLPNYGMANSLNESSTLMVVLYEAIDHYRSINAHWIPWMINCAPARLEAAARSCFQKYFDPIDWSLSVCSYLRTISNKDIETNVANDELCPFDAIRFFLTVERFFEIEISDDEVEEIVEEGMSMDSFLNLIKKKLNSKIPHNIFIDKEKN